MSGFRFCVQLVCAFETIQWIASFDEANVKFLSGTFVGDMENERTATFDGNSSWIHSPFMIDARLIAVELEPVYAPDVES